MWILRTVTEGQPEKTFRILPGNERTIGRATGADFIVDAALVSRVHCRVTALAGGELEITRSRKHERHLRQRRAHRNRAAGVGRPPAGGTRRVRRAAGDEYGELIALFAAKYSSTKSLVVRSR